MRVTGGTLRGRTIRMPAGRVRPTQDRIREALFSILGETVQGAAFLDLYAGSGAVGIEAWSRGAEPVCWVESGRRTVPVLKHNVGQLCGSEDGVWCVDALNFLRKGLAGLPFNIIFADPPYGRKGHDRLAERIMEASEAGDALVPGGMLVMEQSRDEPAGQRDGWTRTDERKYGDTALRFFRRT